MIAVYLLIAIVGLIAVWLPIMLVATLFSGWWELSRAYPASVPAPGDDGAPPKRLQGSVYFSPLFRYQRVVHATPDHDHLHISIPPLIGAFHSPMSIPWAEITFPRRDKVVMGMVPIDIGDRRILVSRSFVKHELEVRALADESADFDAYAPPPMEEEHVGEAAEPEPHTPAGDARNEAGQIPNQPAS